MAYLEKNIDNIPVLDESIALKYSYTMSPEEKINYLVQNLRLVLNNQDRLDIITGDPKLDYREFPFSKKKYNIQQDDFRGEGKAIVDLLKRLNWEKENIIFEKYDISNLSELIKEQQSQLRNDLKQNTHSVSIVRIDDKKYLVDCAYRQFFDFNKTNSIDTQSYNTINLGMFMLKDNKSRQFVTQLLNYGFIEATPENLKAYMDGFEMARRKSFEETGISAEEYIKMLTEDGTIPIHIITSREIVELDIMKKMTLEEVEKAGILIENLEKGKIGFKENTGTLDLEN